MTTPKKPVETPITEPVQWFTEALPYLETTAIPARFLEAAREFLRIAERSRVAALSDEELSELVSTGDRRMVVMEEVARRLVNPKPKGFEAIFAGANPVASPSRPGLPDGYHLTTGPGLPPEGIPCGCIYGEDHDERFFEVPPGGAPREVPQPPTEPATEQE